VYEGDAKDWEAKVHWHGDQLRREAGKGVGAAFLWTDEVSPDWLLTCSNRPESLGLASVHHQPKNDGPSPTRGGEA
jgi:hypothetical protein